MQTLSTLFIYNANGNRYRRPWRTNLTANLIQLHVQGANTFPPFFIKEHGYKTSSDEFRKMVNGTTTTFTHIILLIGFMTFVVANVSRQKAL